MNFLKNNMSLIKLFQRNKNYTKQNTLIKIYLVNLVKS